MSSTVIQVNNKNVRLPEQAAGQSWSPSTTDLRETIRNKDRKTDTMLFYYCY